MTQSRRNVLALGVLIVTSQLLAGRVLYADVSYPTRFTSAAVELKECQRIADDWSRQATFSAVLLALTAILGGGIAAIQGLKNPNIKTITVAMGAVVSTVTVVNTAALDGDYKTLRRLANNGQGLIEGAQQWLGQKEAVTSDGDRDEILQEVAKRLAQFHQLSNDVHPKLSTAIASEFPRFAGLVMEPVVHAEQRACGCKDAEHTQDGFLYFCGAGRAPTISAAKEQATAQAIGNAVSNLSKKAGSGPPRPASLSAYARRVSNEADSCVASTGKEFQVSMLIRMPISLSELRAQEAFVDPAPAARDPFAGRWKLNRSQSSMGIYDDVIEEVRDIHVPGATGTTSWRRVLKSGQLQRGTYNLPCDGAEHRSSGETMTCRVVAPDVVEGSVKTPGHKPPVLYSVTIVVGGVMTIRTYNDVAHEELISTMLYDRVPLT